MNLDQLQQRGKILYGPALIIEKIFPHRLRRKCKVILGFFLLFLAFATLVLYMSNAAGLARFVGVLYIVLALWLMLFCLDALYFSYRFRAPIAGQPFFDFDLALALNSFSDKNKDAFWSTHLGRLLLLRLGIPAKEYTEFFAHHVSTGVVDMTSSEKITLSQVAVALVNADAELKDFFFAQGIREYEIKGASNWVTRDIVQGDFLERFWARERLNAIPALGRAWEYGKTYTLDRYERFIPAGQENEGENFSELVSILSSRQEANALVVGNDPEALFALIKKLQTAITNEEVSSLRDFRVVLFDTATFAAANQSKENFEHELMIILQEVSHAGNVILVFDNFPGFFAAAHASGCDIESLLAPYLALPDIHLIGLALTTRFHEELESSLTLLEKFEVVMLRLPAEDAMLSMIEDRAAQYEGSIFFSFPAIVALKDSAERYFPESIMPDKAFDLLAEVAGHSATARGETRLVTVADVTSVVKQKTGIPMGTIDVQEAAELTDLEKLLGEHIVGQDEAVKAIADAVRRTRAGVSNPNRPLATFLFLGPTGVGKTETTKALGEVFFSGSNHLVHFDMSEYSGSDALDRLIGSLSGNIVGTLSTAMREHPYGVVLFDEFEKSSREVRNLFLQILDEGFFSDMKGERVSMRNSIIIATSNAGSSLIWQMNQSGQDLQAVKKTIIDQIIGDGTFTPELVNRFDGVILFHPLSRDNLRVIARLELKELADRLSLRGIKLFITDDLVDFLVAQGSDPQFGARPMRRAITDIVESKVAEKIIALGGGNGHEIAFTASDFAAPPHMR